MDRSERLELLRAAFPVGTCGWCQRRVRRRSDAMCATCWRELEEDLRRDYLAIGAPTGAAGTLTAADLARDVELERAEWILEHRPPPLLEIRRPPRRRRTRIGS